MELFQLFGSILINDQQAIHNIQNVDHQAQSSSSSMAGAFGKLAGVLAGVFAIDKLKDFGLSAVEAASDAQAMNAQFDQVFGKIGVSAQKTIDGLGKDFGMVPNRIKPAMSQMTSMFKGLGMDTKDAMNTAKTAVTLTADAAAFYDKSFEDANSALNSFIKGNYEGGESIGLFANETQMAAWASKNLHTDWKKLDEKGKQVARLKFAEAMQKAAGATGQAKRESDSYTNQLGNLKQTWTDLKAKLAAPILAPVIQGLKNMAAWLGKVDVNKIINGFKIFGSYMIDVLKPTFDDVKAGLQLLWDKFKENGGVEAAKSAFQGFKDVLAWIKDNTAVVTAVLAGLAGGFLAFQIITGINTAIGIFTTLITAMRTGTLMATLAQWGLNTAMLANPFVWIAVGIGALIAVIVLLWKNWDSVSKWLSDSWQWIKGVAVSVFNWLIGFFKKWGLTLLAVMAGPIGILALLIYKNWDAIKAKAVSIFTSIGSFLSRTWSGIKTTASNMWNAMKSTASSAWEGIKTAITKPITAAVKFVKDSISKIKGFFSGLSLKLPNISTPHFKLKNWSINPLDWAKNMPSIGVDWYARGTNFAPGGLAMVGEQGPELVNLPRGSKVKTASQTKQMMNGDMGSLVKAIEKLASREISIQISGREFIRATANDLSDVLDILETRKNRMGGVL